MHVGFLGSPEKSADDDFRQGDHQRAMRQEGGWGAGPRGTCPSLHFCFSGFSLSQLGGPTNHCKLSKDDIVEGFNRKGCKAVKKWGKKEREGGSLSEREREKRRRGHTLGAEGTLVCVSLGGHEIVEFWVGDCKAITFPDFFSCANNVR